SSKEPIVSQYTYKLLWCCACNSLGVIILSIYVDVDLIYSGTNGRKSEVEEDVDSFVMDSLFLPSISTLVTLTNREAALIIKERRVPPNLSNL
ncbi:hypothetical protein K7432_017618, partial [Basidiobolus ranarum]